MKREDAEEWTQALGQSVSGSYRQVILAQRLGVPQALGMDVREWVDKRLGGYVKYNMEQRAPVVQELKSERLSNRAIAVALGVDEGTIRNTLQAINAENSAENTGPSNGSVDDDAENSAAIAPLDTFASMSLTDKAQKAGARRQATEERERKLREDLERPVAVPLEGLIRGDFRERAKSIPDESIDLVFTDPPYDRDSLPLYEAAAREAARILKPGGSMVCYVGQILLPEALASMSLHLRYWWTAACVHDGGNQIMNKYGIRCGWKPLMWFVKGTRGDVANVLVDTVSGAREKDAHEWQQAESEAAYFIEKLCSPGGTVVDFFAGGGTTCVAAETLGRKWIAFEVNATHYESASARLKPLQEAA